VVKKWGIMKRNEILSFASKWMELDNIILSEVSQALKIVCSTSYANKCSNIIGNGSHTKGRTRTGGIGKGRNPKLERV
jgi:hypothetical protein